MSGNLCFMRGNDELTPLGKWIKDALDKSGRNQVWLAGKIGVQPPQVSRIMRGGSEATLDVLSAIADALGKPRIQAYRAAGHLDPIPEADEWVEETSNKIKLVPPALRSLVSSVIDSSIRGEEAEKTRSRKPVKKGV